MFIDFKSTDWGFVGGDIFHNAMLIINTLASFMLIGIVIRYAPTIVELVYTAVTSKHRWSASDWVEEFRAIDHVKRGRS